MSVGCGGPMLMITKLYRLPKKLWAWVSFVPGSSLVLKLLQNVRISASDLTRKNLPGSIPAARQFLDQRWCSPKTLVVVKRVHQCNVDGFRLWDIEINLQLLAYKEGTHRIGGNTLLIENIFLILDPKIQQKPKCVSNRNLLYIAISCHFQRYQ